SKAQREAALREARHKLTAAEALDGGYPPAKGKPVDPAKAQAEAKKLLAAAEAALARPLTTNYTKRAVKTYPPQSTARGSAFARWPADRDNPLTARVAVNHVWLRHFGQALVPTVFDFGRNGRPPSHPGLLDWLAAEFMEGGWSMKALHRLIVTSAAYRMD